MAELAISVKEAAVALGVDVSTIYEMCYRKTLPHNRVKAKGKKGQGKILISRSALEEWLRGGKL
jgi:excisionase family DNA binding protein